MTHDVAESLAAVKFAEVSTQWDLALAERDVVAAEAALLAAQQRVAQLKRDLFKRVQETQDEIRRLAG